MSFEAFILLPFFICWGSFLNAFAYRLVHDQSIFALRSQCPHCHATLAWYDLIPIISFIVLKGKCRSCKHSISYLYPFIEILTPVIMFLLITHIPMHYIPSYFLFFTALIITIRTDLETMLISRFATILLAPIGFLLSYLGYLPISFSASITGAIFGYFILYLIASIFYRVTRKHGMGQGDLDLLAFIGSFTGISGAWLSLVFGSIMGSIIGLAYIVIAKPQEKNIKIPFGPFLASAAILYVLYQEKFHSIFKLY